MLEANRPPPTPLSASDISMLKHDPEKTKKLGFHERIRHFTWAWYTLTMSAGGLALLIGSQPNTFYGLMAIGLAVYAFNLLLFAIVCSLMATRFFIHGGLLASLTHEREGFFFPTFWLSIATIISGLHTFFGSNSSGSYLIALEVLFWIYCACTIAVAIVQYSYVFTSISYRLQTMMPSWILPAFPIMLSGTIASVIAADQPPRSAIPIIVAGVTFQGLGFSISCMMYAHYIGRLMESGLPHRDHRPGLFICVGPPSFTALALIGMAKGLPEDFKALPGETANDGRVLELLAITAGAFLWALSLWFFCIGAVAVIREPPAKFRLNWWAMVFPNTGFTLATIKLAESFDSSGVKGFASAMSICMICMFLFVFVSHARAVWRQDIMYPGKDEDASD